MKLKIQKAVIFFNKYLYSPTVLLGMFWIFFFKGERFSIQKIIDARYEPKLYVAAIMAVAFLLFLRYNKKQNNKK
ncbi:hypothetical protein AB9T89_17940 [Flavobacterium oncorhynchi]|uniref:hypothetical protein n=1 Tax=Flavobacterium oncorhynchi TaxID=728056 RepID=UPI00351A9EA2